MNITKTVGIFEAKTNFSQLCNQVSRSGQSLLVERRGKALVMITPVEPFQRQGEEDILSAWKRWTAEHPDEETDFPEVSTMRINKEPLSFD
ncbi:MAG: type II toxin-antitoxin system Phd/YefM family antitoxin [Verrucomicrobia bacterium]|nr:type II toxin-antitoxin system Phd/YefM family antitoxin [Verrucomicrobiota bacterium]MCH8511183.1 type II toxin-antitoxin system Phd/YefM family antitoxin [Kiritimatiellia bacterium]